VRYKSDHGSIYSGLSKEGIHGGRVLLGRGGEKAAVFVTPYKGHVLVRFVADPRVRENVDFMVYITMDMQQVSRLLRRSAAHTLV